MSFDLYEDINARRRQDVPVTMNPPEAGVFDNFIPGTAKMMMLGAAKTARAGSMLLGGTIAKLTDMDTGGGTEAQDKYFSTTHEDVFQRAVDYWTPKPHEVGVAGQVAGSVLWMLPSVIASAPLAVASQFESGTEDLLRKGVDLKKAEAVGAVEAAALGLGVTVPILGRNIVERMVLGGAAFNAVQGTVSRGASQAILEGTPAAGEFKWNDPTAMTLDTIVGLFFGGIAQYSHSAQQRMNPEFKRAAEAIQELKPSEGDSLLALRQAQHLNHDSMPPEAPRTPEQINAHVENMRNTIDHIVSGRDGPLPESQIKPIDPGKPEPARVAQEKAQVEFLQAEAERVRAEDGIAPIEVWHGSPHAFDAFSMEHIGTGEGAQAYGHGLYFAENPSVADQYIHAGRYPDGGYTYKVEIPRRAVDSMLDWDRPIGEQPESVRKAFKKAVASRGYPPDADMRDLHDRIKNDTELIDAMEKAGITGIKYFDALSRNDGLQAAHDLYPDQFPKPEQGTRNFVLFDDKLAKVIERNGEAVQRPPTPDQGAGPPPHPGQEPVPAATNEIPTLTDIASEDPLAIAAHRFIDANPDAVLTVGHGADGEPIRQSAREYLDTELANAAHARDDASLIEAAATCLLERG